MRREYWAFDGETLSHDYMDVESRSAGWDIPARDGENLKNQNSDGTFWQPAKPFAEKIIPLSMWVTGHSYDREADPKALVKQRIDDLTRLFGRSDSLYKLERKHYIDGATNRLTNPRFLGPKVIRPTGVKRLQSVEYTAPVDGYIGYEIRAGDSATITVAGKTYQYSGDHPGIAGWAYMESGQTSTGQLSGDSFVYFYDPTTPNHTQVASLFPLPQAISQWQDVSWTNGQVLAFTPDGSGELVLDALNGGRYVYPVDGTTVHPEEPIRGFRVEGTVSSVYLAEVSFRFPANLKLESFPSKLFPTIIFDDTSSETILSPSGDLALVPTTNGLVLPANGATTTYDTQGWRYPGSEEWGSYYGSGVVQYQGTKPVVVLDPLGSGDTRVFGSSWYDAWFGSEGQTVKVTIKNSEFYIVSPTVLKQVGVYTHEEPLGFPPEFYDGDSFNATWTGTPNASQTQIHTSRWIDVECPTDGVDFTSMAGGTRATFTANLIAPKVYWRDNVTITQSVSWTQLPLQSGSYVEQEFLRFDGGTGPVGGVTLDIKADCTETGWDYKLEVLDVASGRTVTLTIPVNETWRLDAENFLFYRVSPTISVDRYASFARVSRNFGGDLITIKPTKFGHPVLRFKTPQYASQRLDFTVKLSGYRRYLSA